MVADEEARKRLQLLAQDIRLAYWKAYSAQALLRDASELQTAINKTEDRLQVAVNDKLIPKEGLLTFRGALLESDRQLAELRLKLDKAVIDLKHLLKLPPDEKIILTKPPASLAQVQNVAYIDFKKLDTITLIMRPELRGQNYQQRIAKFGIQGSDTASISWHDTQ